MNVLKRLMCFVAACCWCSVVAAAGPQPVGLALEIDNGDGCVAPSTETVQDGTYAPLGRPLFIYPSDTALKDPAMDAFLEYYLENVNDVAEQVGFIPLTTEQLNKSKSQLQSLINKAG